MIIGVLSDIHDNLENLNKALEFLNQKSVDALIFCGDFCSPFAARILAESGKEVHAVFGNNDGDKFNIVNAVKSHPKFHLHGEYIGDENNPLKLDGVRIGVTHYPFYAKPMAKTGWYDAVFYGHSHKSDKQKFGNCLMLNPGEIAGVFGPPSLALLDTSLRSSEILNF